MAFMLLIQHTAQVSGVQVTREHAPHGPCWAAYWEGPKKAGDIPPDCLAFLGHPWLAACQTSAPAQSSGQAGMVTGSHIPFLLLLKREV